MQLKQGAAGGVDRDDLAGEAARNQVGENVMADLARLSGSTDNGDLVREKEMFKHDGVGPLVTCG